MSTVRKLAMFRQLSLQCDPPPSRRYPLMKQLSEDIPDKSLDASMGVKVTFNVKTRRKVLDQPLPLKVAWEENPTAQKDPVVVTKCKENRRKSGRLSKQPSIEIENTELSSEEKKVDEFPEKTNINIYLGQGNTFDYDQIGKFNEIRGVESDHVVKQKLPPPMIDKSKNIFEIRRNLRKEDDTYKSSYVPTQTSDRLFERSNSIVVIPRSEEKNQEVVSSSEIKMSDESLEEEKSLEKQNSCLTVSIRPTTAAAKRERFQKRTNSAFSSTVTEKRSPFVRSSSAPSKPERKPKFVATKRRVRTAKNKSKTANQPCVSSENANEDEREPERKFICFTGTEVETMISLVSPEESENEEIVEPEKPVVTTNISVNNNKIIKEPPVNNIEETTLTAQNNSSLRKIVKQVSFQQASIHAFRSFSSSFPSAQRRTTPAATMIKQAGNASQGSNRTTKKGNEKRNSISDGQERDSKRRMIKVDEGSTHQETENSTSKPPHNISIDVKAKDQESTISIPSSPVKDTGSSQPSRPTEEDLMTPKEKQCLAMYHKMAGKGIKVSYDTILRGLLTPTEYRLRRKLIATSDSEATEVEEGATGKGS